MQSVVPSLFYIESEVVQMLEEVIMQLLILSLIGNIALATLSFLLIIAIVIITYKEESRSASR